MLVDIKEQGSHAAGSVTWVDAEALRTVVREGRAWGCNQELSLQRGRVGTKRRAMSPVSRARG